MTDVDNTSASSLDDIAMSEVSNNNNNNEDSSLATSGEDLTSSPGPLPKIAKTRPVSVPSIKGPTSYSRGGPRPPLTQAASVDTNAGGLSPTKEPGGFKRKYAGLATTTPCSVSLASASAAEARHSVLSEIKAIQVQRQSSFKQRFMRGGRLAGKAHQAFAARPGGKALKTI